jgi:hypothetical protein
MMTAVSSTFGAVIFITSVLSQNPMLTIQFAKSGEKATARHRMTAVLIAIPKAVSVVMS